MKSGFRLTHGDKIASHAVATAVLRMSDDRPEGVK